MKIADVSLPTIKSHISNRRLLYINNPSTQINSLKNKKDLFIFNDPWN